jgi:hypothetical protein
LSSIVTGKTQIACWTSCVNWDDKCLLFTSAIVWVLKYHPNCVVYKSVEPLHVIKVYTKLEEQVEVYEVFSSIGWGWVWVGS